MESDIVARLREEGFVTHMARLPRESKLLHAAADEIERLRSLWSEQKSQAMTLFDENRILREEIASLRQMIDQK